MEAQAALVGADCGVELYTETVVYLYLTLIIHPGYTKQDLSLGSYQSLQQSILTIFFLVCLDHHVEEIPEPL